MATVEEVAKGLGVAEIRLRDFLRDRFPRPAEQKNSKWYLTPEMVVAAQEYFGHSMNASYDAVAEIPQKDLNNLKNKASICEDKLQQIRLVVNSKTKPKKVVKVIAAILDR